MGQAYFERRLIFMEEVLTVAFVIDENYDSTMLVGKRVGEYIQVSNVIKGDEALELYEKLIGGGADDE